MDHFFSQVLESLDDSASVRLAQILEEAGGKSWVGGLEGGILETDILKNSIRRHSNSSSLPTYLIATQFASPDPTWKVVSGCIIGSNLCALFDTGRGMARVLYQSLSEHSSGSQDQQYRGVLWRNGSLDTSASEIILSGHPRKTGHLTLCSWVVWDSYRFCCGEFIIQDVWPFSVLNWKTLTPQNPLSERFSHAQDKRYILRGVHLGEKESYCILGDRSNISVPDIFAISRADGSSSASSAGLRVKPDDQVLFNVKEKCWFIRKGQVVYVVTQVTTCFTWTSQFQHPISLVQSRQGLILIKLADSLQLMTMSMWQTSDSVEISSRDVKCSVAEYEKFLVTWRPSEGAITFLDRAQQCRFFIYYACLGKTDTRSDNRERKRYLDLVDIDEGLIVRIEKDKYMLLEI